MKSYVAPAWSSVDHKLEELDLEEERREKKLSKKTLENDESNELENDSQIENNEKVKGSEDDEESEDYDESLYCVACDKSFKSAKSFQNHEKSKKHKENIELLKKHMKEEDMNLFFDKSQTLNQDKNSDENDEEDNYESNEVKQK